MVLAELRSLGGEKFMVYLSDGTEIKVTAALVAERYLRQGMELSEDEVEQLKSESRRHSCRERALRLIGMRPMSCKELYRKLTEKGETAQDAEDCIHWLLERRYLDDEDYASVVVRHCAAKGWGAQRAKNELYRRGVPKEYWDGALEQMPDMEDKVYSLLCSRLRGSEPDRAEIKKATDALYRRGFSWDEIKLALNRYREENSEADF